MAYFLSANIVPSSWGRGDGNLIHTVNKKKSIVCKSAVCVCLCLYTPACYKYSSYTLYLSIPTYKLKYQQPVYLEVVIPPPHINSSSCDLVSLFMFNKSSKHLIMHAAALQAPCCATLRFLTVKDSLCGGWCIVGE